MSVIRCRRRIASRLAASTLCTAALLAPISRGAAQSIPARLSDSTFWRMVTEFSEPGGFFRSDNFVSNETTFQYVIPTLNQTPRPGGVYVGVGPDQNFTYLVALKPRIAFIVDIRRQNLLQHLLYKALIEMSADRAEFLSRLFSRPRPSGLDAKATADALFHAFDLVAPDSLLLRRTLAAVKDRLVAQHHFVLTPEDLQAIDYVFTAFGTAGPDISYSFSGFAGSQFGRGRMPSYAELMVENDGQGVQRSYLASEENFRALKELEQNNLVVPLVGDFAGDKAIRAVGRYLKERGATVTAFYTSNVEQYLFQENDAWQKFFTNVGTLPVDSASTFIRAVFNYGWIRGGAPAAPGPRSMTLLCPIADQLKAFNAGQIKTYYDVVQMSK